jgi:1,4-dihydroxy-2-naphthoyl-CoA hydrolase
MATLDRTIMPAASVPYRLLIDDIDAAGVVFGPRLVAIAHRAVEEVLADRGLDFAAVLRDGVFALPLVKVEAEFREPLRHGDRLDLVVGCDRLGSSSFTMTIDMRTRDGAIAAVVRQTQVAIAVATRTAIPLPAGVRQALTGLMLSPLDP